MKTRKILTCMLAGIMSISALAGCSSTAQQDSTSTTKAADTASAEQKTNADTSAASTEASDEQVTLDMYFPVSVGGGPDVLISNLCNEFQDRKSVV